MFLILSKHLNYIFVIIFYHLPMHLKKIWKKDKQLQSSPSEQKPSSESKKAQSLCFFTQMKSNIMTASSDATLQQLTVIDLTQRNQFISIKTQQLIDKFKECFIATIDEEQSWSPAEFCEEDSRMIRYFAKVTKLLRNKTVEGVLWIYKQLLVMGQKISRNIENQVFDQKINKKMLKNVILFNNAVCYTQLHMFGEALGSLEKIQKMELNRDSQFKSRAKILKDIILSRMGKSHKIILEPQDRNCQNLLNNSQTFDGNLYKEQEYIEIISKSKQQLLKFMEVDLKKRSLSLQNAYNLALLCKKYHLFTHSKTILQSLLSHPHVSKQPEFHKKILILLSRTCQDLESYPESISYLKLISTHDSEEQKQINIEIWMLNKKITLSSTISTSSKFSSEPSKKLILLQNLSNQLNLLTRNSQEIPKRYGKQTSILYRPKMKKKLMATPSQISLQKVESRIQITLAMASIEENFDFGQMSTSNNVRLTKKPSTNKTNPSLDHEDGIHSTALRKKTVKFRQTIDAVLPEDLPSEFIYKSEEKIMGCIISQQKDEALSSINQALQKMEDLKQKLPLMTLNKFKLKCASWCHQIGENSYSCLLLQKYIAEKPREGAEQFRISVMKELSSLYEEMNQYRKAVKVNLELVSRGEVQYLLRNGEMAMVRSHFSEAVQYYQQYSQIKKNTFSLIRLAHAYSKICTHTKMAIQILNQLLFENRNTCEFRHFDEAQTEHIQSGIVLLVSLYMTSKGIKKAQDICQKYLKVNFSAYAIYYLLGMIHNQFGNYSTAFGYFVNALKLKPNHLPSLLETVKHIGLGHSNNAQILNLLRRAFIYNHRNWDVLQLFIQIVANEKREALPISLKRLMECARILEDAGGDNDDLDLEAELVWMWALEYIEQKKHHLPCFDREYITICVRLGEINLQKGNYSASEMYFKKVTDILKDEKFQGSKRKIENVRLELQILGRLAYIKLMQERQEEAFGILNQSQLLATNNALDIWAAEISSKIRHLHQIQTSS